LIFKGTKLIKNSKFKTGKINTTTKCLKRKRFIGWCGSCGNFKHLWYCWTKKTVILDKKRKPEKALVMLAKKFLYSFNLAVSEVSNARLQNSVLRSTGENEIQFNLKHAEMAKR